MTVFKRSRILFKASHQKIAMSGHWMPRQGLYQYDIHFPNSIKDIQSHVVTCVIVCGQIHRNCLD